jgi:hypothetical protein
MHAPSNRQHGDVPGARAPRPRTRKRYISSCSACEGMASSGAGAPGSTRSSAGAAAGPAAGAAAPMSGPAAPEVNNPPHAAQRCMACVHAAGDGCSAGFTCTRPAARTMEPGEAALPGTAARSEMGTAAPGQCKHQHTFLSGSCTVQQGCMRERYCCPDTSQSLGRSSPQDTGCRRQARLTWASSRTTTWAGSRAARSWQLVLLV